MFGRDVLWKFLLIFSTAILIVSVAVWLLHEVRQFAVQGPELTVWNPMLLVMAIAEFGRQYSGTLVWSAAAVPIGVFSLWITFEALFRGGVHHFWRYAGSRLAGVVVVGAAMVLALTLTGYEGLQTGIVSFVVLAGLWGIVTMVETLIRREAVDLLATDFILLLGVAATFFAMQFCVTAAAMTVAVLGGFLMTQAFGPAQFLAAAFLMATAVFLWTIIHSYLVVARYSTIDIMREHVADV